jgi:predicted transglutaminase-like cysteine proteinase
VSLRLAKHAKVLVNLSPGTIAPSRLAVLFVTIFLAVFNTQAVEFKSKLLEIVERRFGDDAVDRLVNWQLLALDLKKNYNEQFELDHLKQVNDFFNQARFASDEELWDAKDYWATPVELLAKNAGDCEDYAIAKFYTLVYAGFDEDKLQISYVKALELNQAHMVLAYYSTPDAEPLILDNIEPDILPASQRPDLEPVYSFNGLGLWLNRFERESAKRIGNAGIMEQWNDMLRRQGIMLLEREAKQNKASKDNQN